MLEPWKKIGVLRLSPSDLWADEFMLLKVKPLKCLLRGGHMAYRARKCIVVRRAAGAPFLGRGYGGAGNGEDARHAFEGCRDHGS